MIWPVRNVDLPRVVRALDTRARGRNGELANFVVAPDMDESRSGFAAFLNALLPFAPHSHTWICEDHWRLLGIAQARQRPGAGAWDLSYLAAMTNIAPLPDARSAQGMSSRGTWVGWNAAASTAAQADVLSALLEYALNAAIVHGVDRFFTRIEDGRPEMELFGKLGFQCYARELTYWSDSPAEALARLRAAPDVEERLRRLRAVELHDLSPDTDDAENDGLVGMDGEIRPDVALRRWRRHDAWGLLRLYDAVTPRRVQMAEGLTADELLHTRAAGGRTWFIPLLEPAESAFVNDRGARLGGWLRLRPGRGAQPHVLSLMAHPDDADVALALLRFGLRVLATEPQRPVVCQVRDYESAAIDVLRLAGFDHPATHALLVRHQTARALLNRDVPALEGRFVYGVRGLGTSPSHLSEGEKTYYARAAHRRSRSPLRRPAAARARGAHAHGRPR